jgi:hypothetical protein
MSLDDLNKELYNADLNNAPLREHEQNSYNPGFSAANSASPFDQEQQWNRVQKGLTSEQKRNIWIGVGVFFLVVLTVAGIFFYQWWQKNAFHQDRVSISFEGPKETDSTQLTKYVIHYVNNNRVTLKNAEIQINYAENFQPIDNLNLRYLSPSASKIFIGDIKPMSEGQAELKGVFYAPRDYPVYLNAEIHFTPSNGLVELTMENKIGVNITAAPITLEVAAPQQAVDGDSLDYVITYKNLDVKAVSNMQLRLDFPLGFQMSSSEPRPSEKNSYWYLGNIEAGQGGKIVIHGQIKGGTDEGKSIVASLGRMGDNEFVVFNKQEVTTKMVSPMLAITQKVDNNTDGVVTAGENLQYTIAFENTGSIGLRDAIVTAEIKGKILDFSKINVQGGSYDGSTNLITWKASDVPALANIDPKSNGTVRFSIPVKSVIPIENELDKNLIISSVAKIDSPDIPTTINSNKIIGSNKLDLKLASKVIFNTKGFYTDDKLKNAGPIPMIVAQETTFTLHWTIINVSNDIVDGKIVSALPTGVHWLGKTYPSAEKITYNERTNQLIWDIGDVKAGTGVFGAPLEVAFQVGVTPQANQAGESVTLINGSVFTAKDSFVGRDIVLANELKNTQLYEDPTVGFVNGKVSK